MSTTQIAADALARIDTMDAKATAAMVALNDYMGTLLDLAALMPSYNTVSDAAYPGTTPVFAGVPIPAFDQLNKADDALEAVDASAESMADLHPGIATLLAEFMAMLAGPEAKMDALAVEAMAIPDIDFSEDNFIAQIIDEVKDAIKDSLTQARGGSTTAEGGYYQNDASRRAAANQKELNDSLGEFAGRGWRLPTEILADAQAAILAKQSADERSADKEILIQQEALSMENRQRAIAAGVRYDQILLSYFERKMARVLMVAKTVFKLGQDVAELKFSVLDGLMEMQKVNLAAVADGRRIVMADLQENTRKFGAKIDALIAEAGQYFDAYHADGQGYEVKSRTDAEVAAFNLSEKEIHLKTLLWNIKNGIDTADDNLRAFSKIADIRLNAAKTGVDMQTSLARAVRDSFSTVVQLLSGSTTSGVGP